MNTNRHHLLLTLLVAMSALAATDADAQTSAPHRGAVPKVVINILVDQLRSDYLEAFAPLYGEDGLQRLLKTAVYIRRPSIRWHAPTVPLPSPP